MVVDRICCEMQGQNGHADDEEDNPGIDAKQPDAGCGQRHIIAFLRPKANRINKAGIVSVRLILSLVFVKQIRIIILESK